MSNGKTRYAIYKSGVEKILRSKGLLEIIQDLSDDGVECVEYVELDGSKTQSDTDLFDIPFPDDAEGGADN